MGNGDKKEGDRKEERVESTEVRGVRREVRAEGGESTEELEER